jgi:hypothetical protein
MYDKMVEQFLLDSVTLTINKEKRININQIINV